MSAGKAFKVLVTHPEVPQVGIDLLKQNCEIVQVQSVPINRAELLEKIRGALDAAGPQLKSISTMSAGIDYVDVPELKRRKIPLGHTPTVLNTAVADLAVGLLIAASRRFHEGRKKIDNDQWENYHLNWLLGQDIRDSTVGFYGFGGIGQAIAKRLSGFDIDKVLYTTRRRVHKEIEEEFNAKKVDFDTLLAQKIVNQDDLYEALKSNRIFSAGLDVTDPEPLSPKDKLLTLDNAARRAIAKRLQCWDVAKIIYHTRTRKENDGDFKAEHVSFENLLKESDFLVVAAPLTNETRDKFNALAFQQMKKSSVFVNVARGGLVNQPDLHDALTNGKIFAAGLDVTTPEPLPADNPLLKLPNCANKPFKVLIAHTDVPPEGLEVLKEKCEILQVESEPPNNRLEILEKIKGVHAAIWGGRDILNAEILDAAAVSTMSSGINNVDVPELKKRGIPLGSTPAMLTVAVADLAVGLLIAAARRFQEGRRKIDSDNWDKDHLDWLLGQDIRDSTVGFYGFGGIGQAVAKRLSGFDIDRVLYTTRNRVSKEIEEQFNAKKIDFDTLLAEMVTPHVGYATKRTRIDAATLASHNVLRGLAGEPMLSPAY
ncbi:hypothetical protein M5D96_003278 [Drosophila gunungcola]|uniref:Glyoxylate reductase/hydroxypyruvate reductase n=1 Tax=Drosophila gunungcola TaxID=103775 RepID=A0A9P9YRS7_9MUSC|nr:hypothetical protein M5D96_003278 [Drosophila gunungcola]